jgi:hypothetical protein
MFARFSIFILLVSAVGSTALAANSGFPVAVTAGPLPKPVIVNGRNHLVYELHLTNVAPIPIEIISLDIYGDDEGKPLASYRGETLANLLVPAENLLTSMRSDQPAEARKIAEGHSVVIFLNLELDPETHPPNTLRHRFYFSIRGNPDLERTVNGPVIALVHSPPPVLHPPLRGSGWIALNALATYDHRRAFQAVDGKLCIAQRFAIDWMQLGPDGHLFHDNPKSNANFYGYGAKVLAVADARVADLREDVAENQGNNPRGGRHVTVDSAVGDYVTLDLGAGRFALYAHLQPHSVKVKLGDKVKAGQVLALLGNSGNSDEPHLHFHLMDANSPLGAEGLPYELDTFTQTGTVDGAEELLDAGHAWQPRPKDKAVVHNHEFPTNNAVVTFP